jgi:hypothetical protein
MMEILPSTVTFSPIGSCIYCATRDGQMKLPKSSCKECAKHAGRMEQTIQRMLLGPFRIRLGLPTRRPAERPKQLEIQIMKDGKVTKDNVNVADFPLIYHTVKLPPPRILSGLPPTDKLDYEVVAIMRDVDPKKYINKAGDAFSVGQFEPVVFYRFRQVDGWGSVISDLSFSRILSWARPTFPQQSISSHWGRARHHRHKIF